MGSDNIARRVILPLEQNPVLRNRVYDALEQLIVERTLVPGERLIEIELADKLGVSRNPVREALTMLAGEGWVDIRPRTGAYVHEPSIKEINDFFEMRALLESYASELAARRTTPEDIASLTRSWERGVAAVQSGDLQETVAANSEFHATIHLIADNSLLQQTLNTMKKRIRWYFATVATQRGMDSWHEHKLMIAALEAGDSTAAGQLMRAHSNATAELFRRTVAQSTDRPTG